MGKPTGFLEHVRELPRRRPVEERRRDHLEIYEEMPRDKLRTQASRCMDCGIPFCHQGCPLGNLIPDWNDLVYRDRWRDALARLHATNNFPEFTGRLCPAPCEAACVLGIGDAPVTIKQVEQSIVDHGWAEGWIVPEPAAEKTGKRVAIIGSGPAGLAAAQQLARVGHAVTVYERADRVGGLLRYGIPDFKMQRVQLDRRLAQLEAEGVVFRTNADVGRGIDIDVVRSQSDAVLVATGASRARDLDVPGRRAGEPALRGVHLAMDYLEQENRVVAGESIPDAQRIDARGKRVIILGGGDTGADCLGTAHRQGAREVLQFELMDRPPEARGEADPWPLWPHVFRTSAAHEEGGERIYSVLTTHLTGERGTITHLHGAQVTWSRDARGRMAPRPVPGTEFVEDCDLLLLAMGFVGPERSPLLEALGVELDLRGNVRADTRFATNVPGLFVAGDAHRGASLIVWAIAEGRAAARAIDGHLMGTTTLPPV
jgi:glutamate synthase (NADPH/NADH) small chain